MNEEKNDDYREAKRVLDLIFIINIHASQHLGSMAANMFIMGAFSSILMNISWLQRFYEKANLDDSEEHELDGGDSLDDISYNLEFALAKMEQTNFRHLFEGNGEVPARVFDLMINNVYTGMYEALSMLDKEMGATETNQPEEA